MLKKTAVSLLGFGLLVAPSFALAQSTGVQSQIAALLAQIKQLQALIAQLQSGSPSSSCVDLSGNLTLGSTGGDVTRLQNYLIAKGDLDAKYNTGYYGFITAQAVGKLQMDLGIVSSQNDTAFGIMGPKTRAAVGCSGTTTSIPSPQPAPLPQPQPNVTFSASPTSGTAPLTVTFTIRPLSGGVSDKTSASVDTIDFGDGSTASIDDQCGQIDPVCTLSHTYAKEGTYMAVREEAGGGNGKFPEIVNRATITVTGSNSIAAFSATPSSGAAPLLVGFSAAVEFGSSNRIDFGDGSAPLSLDGYCGSENCSGMHHTYTSAGTYTATLYQTPDPRSATAVARKVIGSATIAVTSGVDNLQPIINSFTASPDSISAGQSVTISWNASNVPYGGCYITSSTNANLGQSLNGTNNGATGSISITPTATATYTLTCESSWKDGSPQASQSLIITVSGGNTSPLQPSIDTLLPSSGVPGTAVSVHGANFDQNSFVAIDGANGVSVTPTSAISGLIIFTLPQLSAGAHTVQIGEKGSNALLSNAVTFTVGPSLVGQADAHGVVDSRVIIGGKGFSSKNSNNVYFGATLVGGNLQAWDAGNGFQDVVFTVPQIAPGTYNVTLQNENGTAGPNDSNGNLVAYTVGTAPQISNISPAAATSGSTIVISGSGFDQNLVNVDVISQTTNQIFENAGAAPTQSGTRISVPLIGTGGGLQPGSYLVRVRNVGPGQPFGGVASNAVPFTVAVPQ